MMAQDSWQKLPMTAPSAPLPFPFPIMMVRTIIMMMMMMMLVVVLVVMMFWPSAISLPDKVGDSMLFPLKETFLSQLGCLRSQSKIVTSSLPRCRGKQAMRRMLKWKIEK